MRLELKNVGKIKTANIKLDGITVIAGENNTGKSTIGKMLFCVFSAFYKIEEQIKEERVTSVSRVLSSYYHETTNRLTMRFNTMDLAEFLVEKKEMFLGNIHRIENEIEKYFVNKDKNFNRHIRQETLEKLAERIYTFLNLKDCEIQQMILQKRLEAEFAMKVGHLNNIGQKTSVKLNIKEDCIDFTVIKNESIIIANYMNLNKDIIYIDDPFILDDLEDFRWQLWSSEFEHRHDLLMKLAKDKKTEDFSVIDEIIVQKKLEKILNKMCDVCDGDLMSEDRDSFIYKTDRLNGELKMVNLSTGMKSFVILRRLLQNGIIDENGIIILDEPEIHLHPEWQLKFAEIIILIQKEFNANILLNTHSPYFLNALEVYSEKYALKKKCNYYLANEEQGRTSIIDVTNETEKIYAKLAKPLQELENIEYENTKL